MLEKCEVKKKKKKKKEMRVYSVTVIETFLKET